MADKVQKLIESKQFTLDNTGRQAVLMPILVDLINHHQNNCAIYNRVITAKALPNPETEGMASLPFLPVRVFKELELKSIQDEHVIKTLTSSGTTSQRVSKIFLDSDSATRQQKALSSVMTSVLGPERLPMIIVDSKSIITDRTSFSARAAGVLGMMNFGKSHVWLLNDKMELDKDSLNSFLKKYGSEPFLIFGFTFMVWKYLLKQLNSNEVDLSNGILVHSGGWKKLQDEAVSNEDFNQEWLTRTGLSKTRNFYGMVEQIGTIFVEGDDGWLYAPNFADVIIRNPVDWSVCKPGEAGVIQVLSALPTSYPGHILLTEDIGVSAPEDLNSKWKGSKFKVLGRLPKAELRGCSDTHALNASTK